MTGSSSKFCILILLITITGLLTGCVSNNIPDAMPCEQFKEWIVISNGTEQRIKTTSQEQKIIYNLTRNQNDQRTAY